MAKEMEFEDDLLTTQEKGKIATEEKGIFYLGGKRYLMTGESVTVDLPEGANYIKIYAEDDDIRIGINQRASEDSPMLAFAGIIPEVIRKISNLETLAIYGTSGDYCSVSFFREDE